jgi:hypothetical protein
MRLNQQSRAVPYAYVQVSSPPTVGPWSHGINVLLICLRVRLARELLHRGESHHVPRP